MRLKLFAAFSFLAVVAASGGGLALWRLHALVRVYQDEQSEVAAHEAIHEDRIALLSLLELLNRYGRTGELGTLATRERVEARLTHLETSTQACNECHRRLTVDVDVAGQLTQIEHLRRGVATMLKAGPAHEPASRAALTRELEAAVESLDDGRGRMEERFHALLEQRREAGRTVLRPSLWHELAVMLSTVIAALLLAWLMSRALTRAVLPLIGAARRLGTGEVGHPIALPRDRDLAQVASALNEMTSFVAARAREDSRRQLLDRTISSQEEERRRVARDLHDTLGQSLVALLIEIKTSSRRGQDATPLDAACLETQVSGLLDEVRRMAWNLRPALLDDLGLASALARYTEEMARRHGVPIDFQAVGLDEADERLPSNVETVLYRIAQEALSNVARHAHAKRASVVLVRRRTEAALLVEDDGSGFEVSTIRRDSASLGILGMEERVALVGGNLSIESTPGRGTSVRAQIPLAGTAP
jgi:signal transduction histidine kinase